MFARGGRAVNGRERACAAPATAGERPLRARRRVQGAAARARQPCSRLSAVNSASAIQISA